MSESTLADALADALAEIIAADANRELLFRALLAAMGEVLRCDRCFLMVRHPETRIHRNFCWRLRHDLPDTETEGWQLETEWEKEDPMFAAALRAEPTIFVDDIETALSCVLNIEFERNYLGHRALVHAHIIHEGQLWGILQPCLFEQPREWTDNERTLIKRVSQRLGKPVADYVKLKEAELNSILRERHC